MYQLGFYKKYISYVINKDQGRQPCDFISWQESTKEKLQRGTKEMLKRMQEFLFLCHSSMSGIVLFRKALLW